MNLKYLAVWICAQYLCHGAYVNSDVTEDRKEIWKLQGQIKKQQESMNQLETENDALKYKLIKAQHQVKGLLSEQVQDRQKFDTNLEDVKKHSAVQLREIESQQAEIRSLIQENQAMNQVLVNTIADNTALKRIVRMFGGASEYGEPDVEHATRRPPSRQPYVAPRDADAAPAPSQENLYEAKVELPRLDASESQKGRKTWGQTAAGDVGESQPRTSPQKATTWRAPPCWRQDPLPHFGPRGA